VENPDITVKRDLILKYISRLKSSSEQSLNIPSEHEDDFWKWFEGKSRIYYGKQIRKTLRGTTIHIKPNNFCFKNSFRIAKGFVKRLFYFEGFSYNGNDSNFIRHAFNVCKNDRVSDYSLSDKPESKQDFYVGVKIPLTFVRMIYALKGDAKFTQYSLLVPYYLYTKGIVYYTEYAPL
jgi:hypothetical protein